MSKHPSRAHLFQSLPAELCHHYPHHNQHPMERVTFWECSLSYPAPTRRPVTASASDLCLPKDFLSAQPSPPVLHPGSELISISLAG